MAKYGRFDPKNKKKRNDKYRNERRTIKITEHKRLQVKEVANTTA